MESGMGVMMLQNLVLGSPVYGSLHLHPQGSISRERRLARAVQFKFTTRQGNGRPEKKLSNISTILNIVRVENK